MNKKKKYIHIEIVKEIFTQVVSKYISNPKTVSRLFSQVVNAYSAKGRYYHDMNHLYGVISMWYDHKHLLKDADAIFFAAIYHDIVYNPKRNDNEEKSSEFFINKVMFKLIPKEESAKIALTVHKAILATKHNSESKIYYENNKDIQYLLDFDLEILGTRHESTYEWYRKGVRKEYSMYPLKKYKAGRKAVLESFLNRPKIFLTKEFEKVEKRARKNLKNEIKSYLC